jgi:hypothetical protein
MVRAGILMFCCLKHQIVLFIWHGVGLFYV